MARKNLFIPKKLIGEIISYALSKDPDESCGILQGLNLKASRFHPVINIEETDRVNRYIMSPKEMIQVQKRCDEEDEDIIAFFHSHSHSQAFPSKTDIDNALKSNWDTVELYVIASLVEKTRPILRAFSIGRQREIEEYFIDFEEPKYIN